MSQKQSKEAENRDTPEDYFRHQLRMDRNTFQALLGILWPWITRQLDRAIERRIYTCKMHELQNANFVFLNLRMKTMFN